MGGYISFIFNQRNAITLLIPSIIGIQDCLHATHIYFINLVKRVNPSMLRSALWVYFFYKYGIPIVRARGLMEERDMVKCHPNWGNL